MARTIKARHLMLAMSFGLPLPMDDKQIEALAIAWVEFQSEYPASRVSRKLSVVIDLATVSGVTYLPVMAALVQKQREAKARKARPGFDIPSVNPQDGPQPTATPAQRKGMNGSHPTARRQGPAGEEIVLSSGVPDGGKITFD